jgi:Helix-turn-helix domain
MRVELITMEDLLAFKVELFQELQSILGSQPASNKQWLKSIEVRKLLSISPGTLQNLRINGTIRYTKIGGSMYYKTEDITKLLDGNGKR